MFGYLALHPLPSHLPSLETLFPPNPPQQSIPEKHFNKIRLLAGPRSGIAICQKAEPQPILPILLFHPKPSLSPAQKSGGIAATTFSASFALFATLRETIFTLHPCTSAFICLIIKMQSVRLFAFGYLPLAISAALRFRCAPVRSARLWFKFFF